MDANKTQTNRKMDPPSREAMEGKLQIYADGFAMERCLALVLHRRGEGGCEADGRKTLIAAKERKERKKRDREWTRIKAKQKTTADGERRER
jgi:hypothetical protein